MTVSIIISLNLNNTINQQKVNNYHDCIYHYHDCIYHYHDCIYHYQSELKQKQQKITNQDTISKHHIVLVIHS
jgi:hypothetical protein